jgi:hypothetical protein
VSVQESANVTLESGVSTLPGQAVSPPPPPPSTPRWMSTLSGILKSVSESRDEMPNDFATMLMPNHGIEERNLAWNGLHLLSSPVKNISSAVASDNEAALSYQHNLVSANEDILRHLELAGQLIKILSTLNIDETLKSLYVNRPSDEKIDAIRRLKANAPQLSKELDSRIKVLSPAKKTTAGHISKIPTIDSLNPKVLHSASVDFNTFVEDFSSQRKQSATYTFAGERMKYLRPACVAVAQSIIDSYAKLGDMTEADQGRLSAAKFMMSEFDRK